MSEPETSEPKQVKESSSELKWLVKLYCVCLTINTLCFAVIGAFVGKSWDKLTLFDTVIILFAIMGNWTTSMMAFFSKAYSRYSEGKSILPNGNGRKGDTDILKKPEAKP